MRPPATNPNDWRAVSPLPAPARVKIQFAPGTPGTISWFQMARHPLGTDTLISTLFGSDFVTEAASVTISQTKSEPLRIKYTRFAYNHATGLTTTTELEARNSLSLAKTPRPTPLASYTSYGNFRLAQVV